jgi:menaquinone-dependent protoporphyrinogen oxidase
VSGPAVLVIAASRHGATSGIAETIAWRLARAGLDTRSADAVEIRSLAGWDAVVLGSAVYMGRWLPSARAIVDDLGEELRRRPVWLFSSGPVGDPPEPDGERAFDPADLMAATGARDHMLFAGRLDRDRLGLAERAVARAVRAAPGDFRDWDAVAAWADRIAADLATN